MPVEVLVEMARSSLSAGEVVLSAGEVLVVTTQLPLCITSSAVRKT
ncbi:hypothetical protein [Phormidesmis priestleyi]